MSTHLLDGGADAGAAGIADSVTTFCRAAQEVLIVANNEPASLTDAYALIKVLSRDHGIHRAHVIANMIRSAADGYEMFEHLRRVSERFLDVHLNYLGGVPYDEYLQRAIRRQTAVVEAYPSAQSSVAFRNLAATVRKFVDTTLRPEVENWFESATLPRDLAKEFGALGLLEDHGEGTAVAANPGFIQFKSFHACSLSSSSRWETVNGPAR